FLERVHISMIPLHLGVLCLHALAHSFALSKNSTHFFSWASALFAQKPKTPGGGRGILLISQTSSLCLGDSVAIPSVVSFHPVNILLNEVECRVLGSLIEKEITTPEYYPLSLNALVNACNQKSNRDPVMNLDEAAVRQALHSLDGQSLVRPVSASDSRVTKYEHRLQEAFNFYRHEIAILCVLLLRG